MNAGPTLGGIGLDDYAQLIERHEKDAHFHQQTRRRMIARACEFYSVREVADACDLSPGTVWRIADEVARGYERPMGRPGPKPRRGAA